MAGASKSQFQGASSHSAISLEDILTDFAVKANDSKSIGSTAQRVGVDGARARLVCRARGDGQSGAGGDESGDGEELHFDSCSGERGET